MFIGWSKYYIQNKNVNIFSDPEKIVNIYTYIIGEEVVYEWLENYEEEEDDEEEENEDKTSISPFSKSFLKDTFTTSTES